VKRKQVRGPRLLVEVEVAGEVAEDLHILAYVGPRVGSFVEDDEDEPLQRDAKYAAFLRAK
jgi:hypothetical protein